MRTPDTELDAENYEPGPLTKVGIEAIGAYIYKANSCGTFRDYDPDVIDERCYLDCDIPNYETKFGYEAGPAIAELLSYIEPEMILALLNYYHAVTKESDQ